MKKIFVLLLLFVIASCKSDFDKDNLKFEIHKFYVNNSSELGCYGYDLEDYNKISIDSIQEYPKHIYLQEKIEFQKLLIENHIKGIEHKPNLYYGVLELHEQRLDSIKNLFSKTNKDELYYKCYFSYSDSDYNVVMLNEKHKPIECIFELLEEE